MIRTICVAAATSMTAASAWAHSGHGPVVVNAHSHLAEAAAMIAAVVAIAGVAWIAGRYLRSR
ncbi:MAG: hypothetical protein AAGB04_01480 [Pseudomonadota bacterium]